jgi:hypothetical protein
MSDLGMPRRLLKMVEAGEVREREIKLVERDARRPCLVRHLIANKV